MPERAYSQPGPRSGGAGRRSRRSVSARLAALYDPLPCGVTVHDAAGRLIYLNPAAEQMLGVTRAAALAVASLSDLLRLVGPDGKPLGAEALPLGAVAPGAQAVHAAVFGVQRHDGSCRWLQADVVPQPGSAGRPQRVVSSFIDVTNLRQAEHNLRGLAAIVASSEDAIFGFDLHGVITSWNPGAERLFGYAAAAMVGQSLTLLAPPEAQANIPRLLTRIARGLPVRNYEAVALGRNSALLDVEVIVSPVRDATGCVVAAAAIARDVTTQRRAEAQLQASEQRHRELFELASDVIYTIDLTGRLTSVNAAALKLTGYTREELLGRTVYEVVAADDLPFLIEVTRRRLGGEPVGAFVVDLVTRAGLRVPIEVNAHVVFEHGRPVAVQGIARDIRERRRAEAELKHQALHDALTGLPNRTLLYDRLRQGIIAAARDAEPLALLFLDLDRFKEVNDSLGHLAGDQLLRLVAARLQGALRESDTVARLGGDEFAVLLPGTGAHGAEVAAGKIMRAFRQPFMLDERPLTIGASTGVAAFPHHGAEADTLLRCADVAMYMAKRAGGGIAVYSLDYNTSRTA